MSTNVKRVLINADGAAAELYYRSDLDRQPLNITLGGSGGSFHFSRCMAENLAAAGIPTLAIAYFGLPGLPKDLCQIPLEYFAGTWSQALNRMGLDANHPLTIIGRSRGGELALLLASIYQQIRAVAAYSPGHVAWSAFETEPTAEYTPPSWTSGGLPVPSVKMDHKKYLGNLQRYSDSEPIAHG